MGVCWWFLALKKNPAKILNLEQLKNTKENTCNSSDLLGGEARIPYTSRTQLQVRSDWLAKHSGSRAVGSFSPVRLGDGSKGRLRFSWAANKRRPISELTSELLHITYRISAEIEA